MTLNAFPAAFETNYKQLTEYTPDPGFWFWDKSDSLFGMFDALYKSLCVKNPCATLILTLCSIYGSWEIQTSLLRHFEFFEATVHSREHDDCMRLKGFLQDDITFDMAIDQLHRVFLAKRKRNFDGTISGFSLHGSICRWCLATMGSSRVEWIMQASYGVAKHICSHYGE